jgi:hypothetical protein
MTTAATTVNNNARTVKMTSKLRKKSTTRFIGLP